MLISILFGEIKPNSNNENQTVNCKQQLPKELTTNNYENK
jgi:hypothetical protein